MTTLIDSLPWKFTVVGSGSRWVWNLTNRKGDLVMTSHEYPTEAIAHNAAEREALALREAIVV